MSTDAMKVMEWGPEYSMHVGELDREHQIWFDMVNRLHQAMFEGTGVELLRTLSNEMMKHTLNHFSHEEQLMAAVQYPGAPAHIRQHDQLRQTARTFMARFERGETTLTIELMQFLSESVKQHIGTIDLEFGQYLNARAAAASNGRTVL